jgi:hypothetical protein
MGGFGVATPQRAAGQPSRGDKQNLLQPDDGARRFPDDVEARSVQWLNSTLAHSTR